MSARRRASEHGRGSREGGKREEATHVVEVLDLVAHASLHAPVPSRLEPAASLGAELGLVLERVAVRLGCAGGELGLLIERQVEDGLRHRLKIRELVLRETVPLEEEEALGRDGRLEVGGESLTSCETLGAVSVLGQVDDAEFDKGDCRRRQRISLRLSGARGSRAGGTKVGMEEDEDEDALFSLVGLTCSKGEYCGRAMVMSGSTARWRFRNGVERGERGERREEEGERGLTLPRRAQRAVGHLRRTLRESDGGSHHRGAGQAAERRRARRDHARRGRACEVVLARRWV